MVFKNNIFFLVYNYKTSKKYPFKIPYKRRGVRGNLGSPLV
jgi:hypothetical protein